MKLAIIVLAVVTVVSAQQTSEVSIGYNIVTVSARGASTQVETISTDLQKLETAIVSHQFAQVTVIVQEIQGNLRVLQRKVPVGSRKEIDELYKEVSEVPAKARTSGTSKKNKKALKLLKKIKKQWKKFQSGKSKDSSGESESDESDESGESGESKKSGRPKILI